MIDRVSELYRCDWDKAARLNVYEFLNVYCYGLAKAKFEMARQKEEYDKIKAKYGRRY